MAILINSDKFFVSHINFTNLFYIAQISIYLASQLLWFIITVHITTYRRMNDGHPYEWCRKRIKRIEAISVTAVSLFELIFLIISMLSDGIYYLNECEYTQKYRIDKDKSESESESCKISKRIDGILFVLVTYAMVSSCSQK